MMFPSPPYITILALCPLVPFSINTSPSLLFRSILSLSEIITQNMTTVCPDQHKLFFSGNKPFNDLLDVPPRKFIFSNKTFQDFSPPDHFLSSFDSRLRKFLPCNDLLNSNDNHDPKACSSDYQDLDPYSSDHFRMYEFKVRRCTRSRSHDWTDCPFAHPGEKARRRDPRKYHYSGVVCPEFRRGSCSRGDSCEFAHGVFEGWLHPSRYRTEACKDGKNCKRKVCFFAHSPRQLRLLPEVSYGDVNDKHSHCCCHSVTSPTSTLLGMSHMSPPLSPSLSPPVSPVKHQLISGVSPISRYNDRSSKLRCGIMSYTDALSGLMSSLETMDVNGTAAANNRNVNNTIPWSDSSSSNQEQDHHHQQQFILSPSTPNGNFFDQEYESNKGFINDIENKINSSRGGSCDPDLGWVNDLLM